MFEEEYIQYCNSSNFKPPKKIKLGHKFWDSDLNINTSVQETLGQLTAGDHEVEVYDELILEFPEGKEIEKIHKSRERNSQVIQIAKSIFKQRNGKLFCQICGFDFEKVYGEVGKDFIEGHHTIAVSDMKLDHKTRPEEIALLCSNCHRMVHKKRPWLSLNDLNNLLKK